MTALTIKQPWAQLIIAGAKDIENRSWPTSFRGRFAVHSSGKIERTEVEDACDVMGEFIPKFSRNIFSDEALTYPAGYILGTVELVSCVRNSDSPWFFGEYGFLLRDPIKLATPIKARGALGFWNVPADIAALLGGLR